MRLLSVSVSIFGPRKIVQQLFVHNKESEDGLCKELETNEFLQIFKETFVPWCLHGSNQSTSSRLELLLALLDDDCFYEQWRAVLSYAFSVDGSTIAVQSLEFDQITILTLLLENARKEITNRKAGDDTTTRPGTDPFHWHSELLESASVALACSSPLSGSAIPQFLWYVIPLYIIHYF